MSNATGRTATLRKWLVPVLALLTTAVALLYVVLSLRQTVWCYLTDDVSIRENALDVNPRLVIWEEPHRALPVERASTGMQRPAFTPDGATMVFSTQPVAGTNAHLYSSTWNGRQWSEPVALSNLNSTANEKDPALTADGRTLYFASDRPGGHGGSDLWIAQWDGSQWVAVTNAGASINTADDEVAPAAAPDGRSLYFSSNRPKSPAARDFDIFSAAIVPAGATNDTAVQFATARRMDLLNSPADDLHVTFSPRGDRLTFDSNRAGGLGGFDIYESRIVRGALQSPQNFRSEINSPADDSAPALRMEGFDQLFSSNRGRGNETTFNLYAATGREVVSKVDRSRLHSLVSQLAAVKWWILSFIGAVVALVYLIQHYRELTNLFHRCLMASAIIHVVALLLIASWKIGAKVTEKVVVLTNATEDVAVSVDSLAAEKMALALAENVLQRPAAGATAGGGGGGGDGTPLAPSAITIVAKQADEYVPQPDFQPRQSAPVVTTVGRSTAQPVSLQDAPSRGQESSAGGDFKPAPVTVASPGSTQLAGKLDDLPEIAPLRVDVVMEDKPPDPASQPPTADSAFQPVLNGPVVSTVRVISSTATSVVSNVRPRNVAVDATAVPVVTNTVASAKSLVGGSGTGKADFDAADTGGLFARRSGGGDVSSGPRPLTGLGESVTARLASSESGTGRGPGRGPGLGIGRGGGMGSGTGTGVGAGTGPGVGAGSGGGLGDGIPGTMEVPDNFLDTILSNPGKLSTAVVEGLGGSQLTQSSIGHALDWFTRHQETDGRWDLERHGGVGSHDVAGTSLALLCYYGWGVKHNGTGQYRDVVNRALSWLLAQQKADGSFAGNMYDQGLATIVLCESYGLTKDEKLIDPAKKAIAFIEKAQHPQTGGWRYKPGEEGDMSVFGWQYLALRSAEMAGLPVVPQTWDRTEVWLQRVAGGQHGGLYGYQGAKGGGPALTPSGMFCRQLAQVPPTDPRMQESANFVKANSPFGGKGKQEGLVDYYYLYYGTLALYQHQGPIWDEWNERMKEKLVPMQETQGDDAGSWSPNKRSHMDAGGRVVSTAMATLSLEIYYRLLPIYGFGKPVPKS